VDELTSKGKTHMDRWKAKGECRKGGQMYPPSRFSVIGAKLILPEGFCKIKGRKKGARIR